MHRRTMVRTRVYAVGALLMAGGLSACEKLLEAEHLKPRVTHTLKFPYGTIDLTIKRR